MAYQRWPWLMDNLAGDLGMEGKASLFGEGAYPALFNVGEGVGFFAVGPGQGLLYYYDQRQDIAFLFPNYLD